MVHLRRMLMTMAFGCLPAACLSTKRAPVQLSEPASVQGVDTYSVGMLLSRGDRESLPLGLGTIIAETTEQYVGITSLKALDACLPATEEGKENCWIRFNDPHGHPKYAQVRQYSGEAKYPIAWSEFAQQKPVALALFGINKRVAAQILKPVGISTGSWPQDATPTMAAFYAGYSPNGSDAILQYAMASGWSAGDDLIRTSANVDRWQEGAPLFVYVPSRTDYRMVWRLAGIAGVDSSPILARSTASLVMVRDRYPELSVWRRVDWDEKSAPGASGKIDIQSLEIEKSADSAHVKIVAKQTDFKEKMFLVFGASLANQKSLHVSVDKDIVTIAFDADTALGEKIQRLPWIYFEYFDADDKPLFTACVAKTESSKEYECGKTPPAA